MSAYNYLKEKTQEYKKRPNVLIKTAYIFSGLFFSFCLYKNVEALSHADETHYYVNLATMAGHTQEVKQSTTKNDIGTYDYIMVGSGKLHETQNVHLTYGIEISMLQEEEDEGEFIGYVDPTSSEYAKYNNQSKSSATMKGTEKTDPHYYSGNERVSFILNTFLPSVGNHSYSSGRACTTVGINKDGVMYNVWHIGEGLVHDGIRQTSSQWNNNYETWLNDGEALRFAFGFDCVKTGTYGSAYVDMYTSRLYTNINIDNPQDYKKLTGIEATDEIKALGFGYNYCWVTGGDHVRKDLNNPKSIYDVENGGQWYTYVAKMNSRYNYRRTTKGWSLSLHGYSPRTDWDSYKNDEFLSKTAYVGTRPMYWNTYANDGTYAGLVKDYYKKYFCSDYTIAPKPADEEQPIEANTIVLTKQENSTSNIYVGEEDGVRYSGDLYTAPEIYTYNTDDVTEDGSPTFDIGDAIPTTESYRNYIEEDQWYGHTTIEKVDYKTTLNGRVKVTNYYTWKTTITKKIDGEVVPIGTAGHDKTITHIYRTSFDWNSKNYEMAFYRIKDLNLYELESSYTVNNSSGTAEYDALGVNVPYNVRINGQTSNNGSGVILTPTDSYTKLGDWIKNTTYVKWTTADKRQINHIYDSSDYSELYYSEDLGTDPGYIPSGMRSNSASVAQNVYNKECNVPTVFTKQNDIFEIAGYTYLTDNQSNYKIGPADTIKGYFGLNKEMDETASEYEKVIANSTRNIPVATRNGKYYTDLSATYHKIITAEDQRELYVSDIQSQLKEAIKGEDRWLHNEPVVVFSPVMSPISVEGDSSTQLVNDIGNTVGVSQIRLDGTYRLKFDWDSFFRERGYGNPAGYTKYIDEKYLSFPFSVYINGNYYEPDSSNSGYGVGYTKWIAVGPTCTSVDIYIPTWALEGLYGADLLNISQAEFYGANNRPIEVRVEANNVPDELIMSGEVTHNTNAKSDAHYVSTFELPVQISGWIYEFEIDSVYDSTNFEYDGWEDVYGLGIYNFASESLKNNYRECEKRVGTNNRLGAQIGINSYDSTKRHNVRYTADGNMTGNWMIDNTLTMASGRSAYSSSQGFLVPGNTLAFTVKTIANLSDGDDSLVITPDYRYYDASGNDRGEIDIYYTDNSGNLIKMGSEVDLAKTHTISIADAPNNVFYENAYANYKDDTFAQTAYYDYHDDSQTQKVQTSSDSCYSVGMITISSKLRLITGNEEELSDNLVTLNNADSAARYNVGTNNSGKWALTKDEYGYQSGDMYVTSGYNFKNSMQTWYGQYQIPSSIMVCPKGAVESYLSDPNHSYIDGTEDFWYENGYLVLNFDIKSKQDGNEHLQYYSSTNAGMWGNEKGDDPDVVTVDETPIPTEPGDVGVVAIKKNSVKQHFNIGTLYLN